MNIKENIGLIDRLIRVAAAILFVFLFFHDVTTGAVGILSLVATIIFIPTAIFGWCPLYQLLGIRTKMKQNTAHE